MSGKLHWYGPKRLAEVEAELGRRITACAIVVTQRARRLIGTEGASTAPGRTRGTKLRYGTNPSTPGNPPHKQTGRLLASVAYEVVKLVGRAGTNVLYGRWLELGTRWMRARPWLRRALAESRAKMRAILARPMKGS